LKKESCDFEKESEDRRFKRITLKQKRPYVLKMDLELLQKGRGSRVASTSENYRTG